MTDERKRRKRNERQEPPQQPTRSRFTERDGKVIRAVYEYRLLSQKQAHRLLFTDTNPKTAQRRLAYLYDSGYLDRRFLHSAGGMMNSPTLYVLDKGGNDWLMRTDGLDETRWQPGEMRVGYEHLEHLLAINTFRIEVELACRQQGYPLLTWIDDTTLKKDYDRVRVVGSKDPVPVIPDGYFCIETPKGKNHFFLEMDRGSMPSKRFKLKIRAYQAYHQSGLALKRFGTEKFRVLTVIESQKRLELLKKATEDAEGRNRFWFGVLSGLTSETLFAEPVWNVAGRTERTLLLQ